MIRLALVLWLAVAWTANAAPILVKSGEHDGFTRLVMEYGAPLKWKVGRSDDGYQLHVEGVSPAYDLTEAFKLIGKSRLAGISANADSGDLDISIACACYAIPFEFRPGIIVIDLRDGAPPKGSSFELPLEPASVAASAADGSGQMATESRYNWTDQLMANQNAPKPALPLTPMPSSDPSLQILRESLLHQMSRGVAEGVVDIAKLKKSQKPPREVAGDAFASSRVGLGELPGVDVSNGLPNHEDIGAEGQNCIPADKLDIENWGSDKPVSEQMAEVTSGLIGEFDKPNPEALQRAIKLHLFIGFGAEARQLMQAFPSDLQDQGIWNSLANLVDDRPDPNSAFSGQMSCETPAALWAILAQTNVQPGQAMNADAAFLAFSALPIDLRRSIGPRLADRFMAVGDEVAAKRVRDAILRSPDGKGPQVSLLEARLDMSDGDAAKAESKLQEMVANPGPETPAALVALVQARIAQDLPVAADMVATLEAVVQEQKGSADEAGARNALVLAKAASGDTEGAFELLPTAPEAETKVWRILSLLGTDDAILAHAVLDPQVAAPHVDAETRQKLAERLLALGMADTALQWLDGEPEVDSILMAQVQLQRHDGTAALRALTSLDSPEALAMRARALQMLGDDSAAAQIYAQAGDTNAEMRALGLAKRWSEISARGPAAWKQAADHALHPVVAADPLVPDGLLARGKALVEESAATRAAIDALLAQVAKP